MGKVQFFRVLDCGNHTCEKKCHPGPCESCPELPSNITHCPCGTTPLSELSQEPRTSCMDPIPTCDSICNKELLCGPAGKKPRTICMDPIPTCDKYQLELPRPIPRNSLETDHGCTSRIYFDNAGDNVMLTSQKPC